MWYLKGPSDDLIYLKINKSVTFGRKKSDVILKDDASISRLHASIIVKLKEEVKENECTSICILKDEDSKYGTYILRDEQVIEVTKEGCNLKHQDKIKFGLQSHIFSVTYYPIITVVSTLTENDKNKLQNIMNEIDGIISTEWVNNCTHLTVSKATLTEKVVWALASVTPIVILDYWEAVRNAIENNKEVPTLTDFLPPISEALINKDKALLCPNEMRKTLFKDKVSVHFSVKQYKTYGKMIFMTGGRPLLFSKKRLTIKQLCLPNVIVLQHSNIDATQSTECTDPDYDSICNALQEKKRRLIPESEIPIAILYCSTEKYCNPEFNFVQFLKRSKQQHGASKVIVLDTQDVSNSQLLPIITSDIQIKSNISIEKTNEKKIICIPESLDSSSAMFTNELINNSVEKPHSITIDDNILERDHNSFDSGSQKSNSKRNINNDSKNIIFNNNTNSYSDNKCNYNYHKCNNDSNNSNDDVNDGANDVIFVENFDNSIKKCHERSACCIPETMESCTEENFENNVDTAMNSGSKSSLQVPTVATDRFSVNKIVDISAKVEIPEKCDLSKSENSIKIGIQLKDIQSNKEKRLNQDNDEEYVNAKKVCLEDFKTKDFTKSFNVTKKFSRTTKPNKDSETEISFFRTQPGSKTFKKVYTSVPEKRITLEDMYLWRSLTNL